MRLTVTLLHIKNAILLEDGAEHGLDNDAGGGVSDEGGLLVELLGEEVDAEVAVLAGGGGGRDADHLAGAALEHQEIANAHMVAGDGDRVGNDGDAAGRGALVAVLAGGLSALDGDALPPGEVATAFWDDLVSELMETLAEGMIMT